MGLELCSSLWGELVGTLVFPVKALDTKGELSPFPSNFWVFTRSSFENRHALETK